jgi:hypothetical protein
MYISLYLTDSVYTYGKHANLFFKDQLLNAVHAVCVYSYGHLKLEFAVWEIERARSVYRDLCAAQGRLQTVSVTTAGNRRLCCGMQTLPEMLALASWLRVRVTKMMGDPGFVTLGYSSYLVIATFVRTNPGIIILNACCCRRSQSTLRGNS